MLKLSISLNGDTFVAEGDQLSFDLGLLTAIELWANAKLERPTTLPREATSINFFKIEGGGRMALFLKDTEKCTLGLDPRDSKGNVARLDGAPTWGSSDETLATVVAAADGLSAVVTAVGPVGTAQINVTADARIGPEIVELSGTLEVQIQAGEAVTLGITTGTPEPQ